MKKFIEQLTERLKIKEEELERISSECELSELEKERNYGYYVAISHAIEIVKQLAEEYNQGHFGCNTNGEHEKCTRCGVAPECQIAYKYWFGAKDNENGWIPCSEQYPDTDEYILLSFENFSVPIVGRYEEDEHGGAFYIGDETEGCVSQNLFVNAWMELPKPYSADIGDAKACANTECPHNKESECPAAEGCAGYEESEADWKEHMMNRFMRGE